MTPGRWYLIRPAEIESFPLVVQRLLSYSLVSAELKKQKRKIHGESVM